MKPIIVLFVSFLLFVKANKTVHDEFVVIQLFTSQGCSSCPPADRLVERIKDEFSDDNVFVLSYHVDYWNRLGWKDPYSKRKFTEIQYSYASEFREKRVYTPQIVVNGREHFVGSDEFKLRKRIKSYSNHKAQNSLKMNLEKNHEGDYIIKYNVVGETNNKMLKIAVVLNKSTTDVKRGENRNQTLSNSNIVLEELSHTLHNKKNGSMILKKSTFDFSKELKIIGFVQDQNLTIHGATQLDI